MRNRSWNWHMRWNARRDGQVVFAQFEARGGRWWVPKELRHGVRVPVGELVKAYEIPDDVRDGLDRRCLELRWESDGVRYRMTVSTRAEVSDHMAITTAVELLHESPIWPLPAVLLREPSSRAASCGDERADLLRVTRSRG